jgi:hypothetical protein
MRRGSSFSFPNPSWRVLAPVVVAGVMIAGCGSSKTPPTTTTAPTTTIAPTTTSTTVAPTTTATPATKTCLPAQLTVLAGPSEGAAGTIGRVYQLQNSSSATCSLFGYPGLGLLDGSSKPLPTTVVRQPGATEAAVTLTPGGSAYFTATWPDATGYNGATCPTSAALEITPPNDTTQVVVNGAGGVIQAFGGTTTGLQCGTITVTPVRATANA